MVVIPVFGGLLGAIIALLWPAQLDLWPRIALVVATASATALLFALKVYFSQIKPATEGRSSFIKNIWMRAQRNRR